MERIGEERNGKDGSVKDRNGAGSCKGPAFLKSIVREWSG